MPPFVVPLMHESANTCLEHSPIPTSKFFAPKVMRILFNHVNSDVYVHIYWVLIDHKCSHCTFLFSLHLKQINKMAKFAQYALFALVCISKGLASDALLTNPVSNSVTPE